MKFIIITLMLVANFAFAQQDPADGAITQATPAEEAAAQAKDIKGTIAEPTHEQKKHVHEAAKKAKKKKAVKKHKALKKTKAVAKKAKKKSVK